MKLASLEKIWVVFCNNRSRSGTFERGTSMNIQHKHFGKPLYRIYCRGVVLNEIWYPYGGSKNYDTLEQAQAAFEEIKKEIKEDNKAGLDPWPIERYKIVKIQQEFVDALTES